MNPFFEFFQKNHALAKIEHAQLTKQTNILLEDFDLLDVPNLLYECHELHSLFLARNKITKLSIEICNLKNLHTLAIDYNKLEKFPSELIILPHLKTLNISHNQIKDLTSDIGKLKDLEALWCNCCGLTSLPDEIGILKSLDTLGARNNLIEELPESMCKLQKLRWLTLENNKLSMLPKSFHKLELLVHLNLNRNKFISIPYQVAKLKKLRYIMMQHNNMFTLNQFVLLKMRHVYKINLMHNPIIVSNDIVKKFCNLLMPGSEWEAPLADTDETNSDESSEDWEESIDSSELDFGSSESETEDEEVIGDYLPKLSKYLVTY
ncbi:hypothetical protein RI129_011132 [Pyrocoelia pectoralis]|uniref:Leucine rich repeat protein n=1 Tax=Pyrocoelia pectoralis TaxID=417401 RepID=A0AAN7V8B5_9COLE